jgi:glycosyltransferase involved in cell wall biosynthesis
VVGEGPERQRLESISTTDTKLVGHVSSQELAILYNNCIGLLQLGEEDFGITALEALSYGKPAVVHHKSGAAELIKPGIHGLHIKGYQLEEVMATIDELQTMPVESSQLVAQAKKYQTAHFKKNFARTITELWQNYRKGKNVVS